jgi:ATP-dependent DNA ligase
MDWCADLASVALIERVDFGGLQVDERGISLRFPRFLRVRDDKGADDATGPDQVNLITITSGYKS